jgi:hypothetical protein
MARESEKKKKEARRGQRRNELRSLALWYKENRSIPVDLRKKPVLTK